MFCLDDTGCETWTVGHHKARRVPEEQVVAGGGGGGHPGEGKEPSGTVVFPPDMTHCVPVVKGLDQTP